MATKRSKKAIAIVAATVIVIMACLSMLAFDVCAESRPHEPKTGVSYVLKHSKYIFRNHNKSDGIKRRRELSDSTKKYTVRRIKKAKLKRGTVVTCLEVHKKWIRIPSGWIKIKKDDLKAVNKQRRY